MIHILIININIGTQNAKENISFVTHFIIGVTNSKNLQRSVKWRETKQRHGRDNISQRVSSNLLDEGRCYV